MTESLGRAELELATNQGPLDAGLKQSETKALGFLGRVKQSFSKLSGSTIGGSLLQGVGLGAGMGAFGLIQAGIGKTIEFFGDAINAASDLAETTSKVTVVFGDQADKVLAMGENSAEAMGMSSNAALAAAGTYGNLFRAMGLTEEASADMSVGLVNLAADLASFNNMDPTEVMDKLRSGLSGETEPLKSLGINLNVARIQAKALEMGLVSSSGVMTTAAKAQATYALVLEDTTLAQGDFARTSDGLANTQRQVAAEMENITAEIGEALLPMFLGLMKFIKDPGIPILRTLIDVIGFLLLPLRLLLDVMGKLADVVGSTLNDMALNFGDFGDTVHRIADDTGNDFQTVKDRIKAYMEESGLSFEQAADAAERDFGRTAVAATEATDEVADGFDSIDFHRKVAMDHLANSADETTDAVHAGITIPLSEEMQKAVDKAMESAREVPGGWAVQLDNGTTVFAGSAEALANALPKALQAAQTEAVDIAEATPVELAKALVRGQTDWQQAIEDYRKVLEDDLTQAVEIAKIKGYLAGKELAAGLNSSEPERRAAAEALKGELEARLFALQNDVPGIAQRTGTDYADALSATQSLAKAAGGDITDELLAGLEVNLRDGGIRTIQTWIDGIASQRINALQTAARLAAGVSGFLSGNSPPPEGPLRTIDKGGSNIVTAWLDAMLARLGDVTGAGSKLAQRAREALTIDRFGAPAFAMAAPGAGSAAAADGFSGGPRQVHYHYELTVDGVRKTVSGPEEAIDELRRLGVFGGG